MTKDVIQDSIYWFNELPSDNEVSDTLSTDAIVEGLPKPNYDKLTIDSGSYVQVHTGTNNNTKSRTVGEITLRTYG